MKTLCTWQSAMSASKHVLSITIACPLNARSCQQFGIGLAGKPKTRAITMAEVKQHRSKDDAWLVLKGKVIISFIACLLRGTLQIDFTSKAAGNVAPQTHQCCIRICDCMFGFLSVCSLAGSSAAASWLGLIQAHTSQAFLSAHSHHCIDSSFTSPA